MPDPVHWATVAHHLITHLRPEGAPVTDPMPVFTIKAKDILAGPAIRQYRELCAAYGLHDQAVEVDKAVAEIVEWQNRNLGAVKLPDHPHVPVTQEAR